MDPKVETAMYELRAAIEACDTEEAVELWWALLELLTVDK